jgi:hypothetical protein
VNGLPGRRTVKWDSTRRVKIGRRSSPPPKRAFINLTRRHVPMMEPLTIQASRDASPEDVKIVPFKCISRATLPYSFLPRDSAWDAKSPWRMFSCPPDHTSPFTGDITFAKVYEGDSKGSHLAVVQQINGDVWSLCKLDSGIRMRDIRSLSTYAARSEQVFSDDPLQDISISPTWQIQGHASLEMFAANETKEDASTLLTTKYFETLYNANTPVVYFAKSTLAKVRNICKLPKDEHKPLAQVLGSRLLQVHELDKKHDIIREINRLKNPMVEGDYYSFCKEEIEFRTKWMLSLPLGNDEGLRKALELLKLRETQLHIILLLELLSTGEEVVQRQKEPRKLVGSVVRKKKKQQNPEKKSLGTVGTVGTVELPPGVAVDILFDRLCIHQAIDVPDTFADRTKVDKVKEFCLEIVLPYFGSRLPERTKAMFKKARGMSTRAIKHDGKKQPDAPDAGQPMVVDEVPELQHAIPATATKSALIRGGILASTKTQQKRQIEMTFGHKKDLEKELASAIKNVAKPNRLSVAQEFAMSKPVVAPKKKKRVIQVPATPAIKRTVGLPDIDAKFATPKKPRYNEDVIESSPIVISTPGTIRSETSRTSTGINIGPIRRLDFGTTPTMILATPDRGVGDTDDDMEMAD